MKLGMIENAQAVWSMAEKLTNRVEARVGRIHKGSMDYFHAVTCILKGELDKGFFLMHSAMKEDDLSSGGGHRGGAAHSFVTLDDTVKTQFFGFEVSRLASLLGRALSDYNTRHNRQMVLNINLFRKKFLDQPGNMEEVAFSFVYCLARMEYIKKEIPERLLNTHLASIVEVQKLFDLCLVLDRSIAELHTPQTDDQGKVITMARRLELLSGKVPDLGLDKDLIGQINQQFQTDVKKAIVDALGDVFTVVVAGKPTKLTLLQTDFAIAYGIRNFAGHNIEPLDVVGKHYSAICSRILNAIFFVVETSP